MATDHTCSHKVSVIIILYNPDEDEIKNVQRLSGIHNGIIVDNSPVPAFKDTLLNKMSYVALGRNAGIAEAQNIGLRHLLNHSDATHIVFLDQDSTVPDTYPQDIAEAFDCIRKDIPNLGFLGPMTENKETGREYRSVIHKDRLLQDGFILRREIISSGGCTARDVLEDVGLNEERLFIDYVDFEWCWRARSKGYVCGLTPHITIRHMVGQKTIYIFGYTIIVSAPVRYYYQFRNYMWLLGRGYVPLQWKVSHGIKNLARLVYFPILMDSGVKCWKYMVKGLVAGVSSSKQRI